MYEPKIGDVVTLKSRPDVPMNVTAYLKDKSPPMYEVMWLTAEGHPIALTIVPHALARYEEEVDIEKLKRDLAAAQGERGQLAAKLLELAQKHDAVARELGALRDQQARAVIAARGYISTLPADITSDALAKQLVELVERTIREANEQIALARSPQ